MILKPTAYNTISHEKIASHESNQIEGLIGHLIVRNPHFQNKL